MKNPEISVLMTVDNSERHLQCALDSLSSQTFGDFELIVLEHGSSDRSLEILNSWNDKRMKLEVLPVNIGRTSALNRCLERSTGRYVAILDSDDIAVSGRFGLEVAFLDTHLEVGLVGTWCTYIDDSGRKIREHQPPSTHESLVGCLAMGNPFTHSSLLYRRELALKIGGYNSNYFYATDFCFIVDMAKQLEVAILPNSLCHWRETYSSLTKSSFLPLNRLFEESLILLKVRHELELKMSSQFHNLLKLSAIRVLLIWKLCKCRLFCAALATAFSFRAGRKYYLAGSETF